MWELWLLFLDPNNLKLKIEKVYDLLPNRYLLSILTLGVQKNIGHFRLESSGGTLKNIQSGGEASHQQTLGSGCWEG